MKNLIPVSLCCGLLIWSAMHTPETSTANAKPSPSLPVDVDIRTIEPVTADDPVDVPAPIVADVDESPSYVLTSSGATCSSGSCSAGASYAATSRRWYPAQRVVSTLSSRRQSARSSGRWYLGKNLGRLFGRRR